MLSNSTVHVWLARYEAEGLEGLMDAGPDLWRRFITLTDKPWGWIRYG